MHHDEDILHRVITGTTGNSQALNRSPHEWEVLVVNVRKKHGSRTDLGLVSPPSVFGWLGAHAKVVAETETFRYQNAHSLAKPTRKAMESGVNI